MYSRAAVNDEDTTLFAVSLRGTYYLGTASHVAVCLDRLH